MISKTASKFLQYITIISIITTNHLYNYSTHLNK